MKYSLLKKMTALLSAFALLSVNILAFNIGDVTGKVLATDIRTYINNVEITSYNIAGRTAIISQDLQKFGYNVLYDNDKRELSITDTGFFDASIKGSAENNSSIMVGTPVMDVVYTDIRTFYGDSLLESFNIGGLTCIYADDLAKASGGTYVWDEFKREVHIIKGKYTGIYKKITAGRMLGAGESETQRSESLSKWSKAKASHLTKNPDGTYVAVEVAEHINIEKYDSDFSLIDSFAIKKELPIFGALYFGEKYNYIAFGQENLVEDNSREVIRLCIYDKNFVKISEVSVNNCKTTVPFDASGGEIAENERYIMLHTSRTQYADKNGIRPQTQLTVIIDKTTWKVCNILGKYQLNHTSHALKELVEADGENFVTVTLSDAAPYRGAVMTLLNPAGEVLKIQNSFSAGGPAGANCTGLMPGNLVNGKNNYLFALSAVDSSKETSYDNISVSNSENQHRDIYLVSVDKKTDKIKHTMLENYSTQNRTGGIPYLVDLKNGYYMTLWDSFTDNLEMNEKTVHFAITDETGNLVSEKGSLYNAYLSPSCEPIVDGNKVIWYHNTLEGRVFSIIDISTLGLQNINSGTENNQYKEDIENNQHKEETDEAPTEENEEYDEITEVDGI